MFEPSASDPWPELNADTRWRVLLRQNFPPEVAGALLLQPQLLAGRTCEVTILFADLRSFTAIAERLAPDETYRLLGDVMELFTEVVHRAGGMVIDYYGDGLAAMWNAPLQTHRHADLACCAGVEMIARLPQVSAPWESRTEAALRVGIGVHTGAAQVGNSGTQWRFKYGPRGSAVNIASRVQSATKTLATPLLVSESVQRQLTAQWTTVRICTAKLPGLRELQSLWTVFPASDAARLMEDLQQYTDALHHFEHDAFEAAERLLKEVLSRGRFAPAEFLSEQVAAVRNRNLGRRSSDETNCTSHAIIEILGK
jgi:adenylate cyclase